MNKKKYTKEEYLPTYYKSHLISAHFTQHLQQQQQQQQQRRRRRRPQRRRERYNDSLLYRMCVGIAIVVKLKRPKEDTVCIALLFVSFTDSQRTLF